MRHGTWKRRGSCATCGINTRRFSTAAGQVDPTIRSKLWTIPAASGLGARHPSGQPGPARCLEACGGGSPSPAPRPRWLPVVRACDPPRDCWDEGARHAYHESLREGVHGHGRRIYTANQKRYGNSSASTLPRTAKKLTRRIWTGTGLRQASETPLCNR